MVYKIIGIRKANTTVYRPQTDVLVERFHRILTDMLAKSTERGGKDWNCQLPYILFAYRASKQRSTGESPFFLLYGCDPHLLTEVLWIVGQSVWLIIRMLKCFSTAWELARLNITKAQQTQKKLHPRNN